LHREVPADHRANGQDPPAVLRQAVQAATDDLADPLGDRPRSAVRRGPWPALRGQGATPPTDEQRFAFGLAVAAATSSTGGVHPVIVSMSRPASGRLSPASEMRVVPWARASSDSVAASGWSLVTSTSRKVASTSIRLPPASGSGE